MPKPKWKPRLTVELTEAQYYSLKRFLDFGMQRRVFSIVVDDLIRMLERYGRYFVIALLKKEISYAAFMEEEARKEDLTNATPRESQPSTPPSPLPPREDGSY